MKHQLASQFHSLCSEDNILTDELFGDSTELSKHMKEAELGNKIAKNAQGSGKIALSHFRHVCVFFKPIYEYMCIHRPIWLDTLN